MLSFAIINCKDLIRVNERLIFTKVVSFCKIRFVWIVRVVITIQFEVELCDTEVLEVISIERLVS